MNRGGSWNNTSGNLSLAYRNNNTPVNVNNNNGFRPVLVPQLNPKENKEWIFLADIEPVVSCPPPSGK